MTVILERSKKAALVAVFLFVIACAGEEAFEPAPGAAVAPDDLPALVSAAVATFNLEERSGGPLDSFQDDRPPCDEQEVWINCSVGSADVAPGWQSVFTGEAGPEARILLHLQIGVDGLEAEDMLDGHTAALGRLSTDTLRNLTSESPGGFTGGPCDIAADRDADTGCAWYVRSTPVVGDHASAHTSDVLPRVRMSAVLFARGHVFARIEVLSASGLQSERVANQLAEALDAEIMEALSR